MKIHIPTECPCCSSKLVKVNDQLFCKNSECSAQLTKKVEHFSKVLGIKGMGIKTIEKLNLADLTELFYLDFEYVSEALGSEKIAEKLLNEIEKAKSASLATVLASFSIPLIGETASNKLVSVVNDISEINEETCKKAGLGEKATANLLNWLNTEFLEIKEFLPFSFKVTKSTDAAVESKGVVCITGKLKSFKTKSEAKTALDQLGYKVVDSLTKATDYLVDEENKGSAKRIKAEQNGIIIITNLIEFIGKIND